MPKSITQSEYRFVTTRPRRRSSVYGAVSNYEGSKGLKDNLRFAEINMHVYRRLFKVSGLNAHAHRKVILRTRAASEWLTDVPDPELRMAVLDLCPVLLVCGRTRLFRGSNGAELAWLLFLNILRALRLWCLSCVVQCKCYER